MTSDSQSQRLRLLNLRLNLLKIARDVQEANGRIETADLTYIEQAVSTLDEVVSGVSGALPSPTAVRKTKFLWWTIAWRGKKAPKSPK